MITHPPWIQQRVHRSQGWGRLPAPSVRPPHGCRYPRPAGGPHGHGRPMRYAKHRMLPACLILSVACGTRAPVGGVVSSETVVARHDRLPTGARLDPIGTQHDLRAAMPLALVLAPSGRSVVISSAGYREPGVDVVDLATGEVVQSLPQPAAFLGAAFSPDGRVLFASGAHQDVVYLYRWANERASLAGHLELAPG